MRAFRRVDDGVESEVEEFEAALLTSLIQQLQELLGGAESEADAGLDAFQWLAAQRSGVELDHDDPLIQRLFPNAYADPALADEFRRFTEDDARRARVAQASVVLRDLAGTLEGAEPLRVLHADADAWLKTINALRLSLSVRLEIADEASLDALARLPARDPRSQLLDLYDWLGYVLESLLEALAS
jgi:Domain of unknown function (DUF2017)